MSIEDPYVLKKDRLARSLAKTRSNKNNDGCNHQSNAGQSAHDVLHLLSSLF